MTDTWAIILAAGSGTRIAEVTGGVRKQYLELDGVPVFWRSAVTLGRMPSIDGLVFVFPEDDVDRMRQVVADLDKRRNVGLPWKAVAGGVRRQDSVRCGLEALPVGCGVVLVHDSARPFASPGMIRSLLDAIVSGADGAIPAIPVTDTVKRVDGDEVIETLHRSELRAVQTPQAFRVPVLREAHDRAEAEGWDVTDDASMVERLSTVKIVAGEASNVKITNPEDLKLLEKSVRTIPVIGWGYDVHRYGGERPMVLGGVPIPGGPQVKAHSDGDVLLHALTDAVLGTFGGGDIGQHFPDTDKAYEGADSGILLKEVLELARRAGVEIVNADLTVIAQTPKLSPHGANIRRNVARLLGLDEMFVNFKATTEEKLGFTGEKKGVKAVATVSAARTV